MLPSAGCGGIICVQSLANKNKIPPSQTLRDRIAQQIGGVKGCDCADRRRTGKLITQPFAAEFHDPFCRPYELFCCCITEKNKNIRREKLNLPLNKGQANLNFFRRWGAVPRRPPEDKI